MQNPQAAGAQARAGGSEALRERMARDGPSCSLFSNAALQCPVTPLSGRGVSMSQGEGPWPEWPSPGLLPSVPACSAVWSRQTRGECPASAVFIMLLTGPGHGAPCPWPLHSGPGCGLTLPALVHTSHPNTPHRDAFMSNSHHPTRLVASVACGLGEARALRPCSRPLFDPHLIRSPATGAHVTVREASVSTDGIVSLLLRVPA